MVASLIPLCIKLLVHDKFTLGTEAEAITEFLSPQGRPADAPVGAVAVAGTRKGTANTVCSTVNGYSQQGEDLVQPDSSSGREAKPQGRAGLHHLPVVHSGAELRLGASLGTGGGSQEDSGRLPGPQGGAAANGGVAPTIGGVHELACGDDTACDGAEQGPQNGTIATSDSQVSSVPSVLYRRVPLRMNIQDLFSTSFSGCQMEQFCRDCRMLRAGGPHA